MIYLLVFIITLLCLSIIGLSLDFKQKKLRHDTKVRELNYIIAGLIIARDNGSNQLFLSDESRETLMDSRIQLDKEIMALQADLFQTLDKNNLL